MKMTHSSRLLLLGFWLAVLLAGYMTSRASVFAAGGQDNCVPCKFCNNLATWWSTTDNKDYGYVYENTQTPAPEAYFGSSIDPTAYDAYTTRGCDAFDSNTWLTGSVIVFVNYDSATQICTDSLRPLPLGLYECNNPNGINPTDSTLAQELCGP